jgi:predicted lipid-binding transport protein (Tim44 family)
VILPRVRLATPSPELPEPDVESFAVARPEEIPLVSPPPAAPVPASAEAPPEPIAASAWLGLSLLASLALGGLIAALRRRREQPVE